jgi:sugar fermentation stimulation protein A
MLFPSRLIRGTLVQRYKRFLADVRLSNGEIVTAHCTNTGSMLGCKEPGSAVYLSLSPNKGRKLPYTWEMIQIKRNCRRSALKLPRIV